MSLAETIRKKVATSWRIVGGLILAILLAGIIRPILFKPAKTNGAYLQEVIETRILEKTATALIVQLRMSPEMKDYKESDWKQMEEGLSACLVKKASEYAASNDPYLNVRADMDTPTNLANRFLKACGAIE